MDSALRPFLSPERQPIARFGVDPGEFTRTSLGMEVPTGIVWAGDEVALLWS
jgi:hypothetical protein